MFLAHVEEEVEAAHANGPEGHKCQEMHGHTWMLIVEFTYGTDDLDTYGWGPDFGAVKKVLKALDHRNLNRMFSFPPSAENIATYIYNEVANFCFQMNHKIADLKVIVHEGGGNSITYSPSGVCASCGQWVEKLQLDHKDPSGLTYQKEVMHGH